MKNISGWDFALLMWQFAAGLLRIRLDFGLLIVMSELPLYALVTIKLCELITKLL